MSRKECLVGITFPSFFSVTWFTPTTPWSFSSSWISTSDMSVRSWHLITPWEEFRVLWIETLAGLSINLFRVGFGPGPFCHTPPGKIKSPQPFNAFDGSRPLPGNPSEQQRATVCSAGGRHLTTPQPETLANCCRSCRSVRFQSLSPNLGHCPVIFFHLWVPCYVSERFIMFVPTGHRVQQGDAHKRHSSKCASGLKMQYTQVIKTKVYFYPLIDPKPLLSNRN